MKRKWRFFAVIGAVVVAAIVGRWLWLQQREEPALGAVTQMMTTVQRGTLTATISGTGSIEPVERKTVAASVAGTVAEVYFQDGERVKKGDVLVTFEREDDNAERQIESKQISLEKAKLDLESLQLQYKNAMKEDQNTDAIRLNIRSKELDIRQLEQEIADLREQDAGPDPITAPIDGKLTGFDVAAGAFIRENAELGEVVNYDQMKLTVRVDELDIAKVEPGQRAEVRVDALPDRVFAGTVAEIADEGTSSNGVAAFDVTVLFAEADGLKAGMSAEATIVTMEKKDALYLPIEAVHALRGEYFVFVPGEEENVRPPEEAPAGTVRERLAARLQQSGMKRVSVEVGAHNEDFIEIVSGLSEGDAVIILTAASGEAGQNAPAMRIGGFRSGAGFSEGGFPGGRDGMTRGGAVPGGAVPGGGISGGPGGPGGPGGAVPGGGFAGGGISGGGR